MDVPHTNNEPTGDAGEPRRPTEPVGGEPPAAGAKATDAKATDAPPAGRFGARRWRARGKTPFLPERGWLRATWKPLAGIAALVLGVSTFEAWLATCGFDRCPTTAEIKGFQPAEGGRILDRNGRMLGRMTAIRRINVPLEDVPEHVRQAFIATEDRRFYEHDGIDPRGIGRAALANIKARSVREGFSTITMQAARNTFLAHRFAYTDRSLRRKLIEVRIAALMEQALTKDEILELYLNVIYLGNGTYGVEAASRDLFGRSVEHVTIAEAAMLAALPKGPSAYTPRRDPQRAKTRRNVVLGLMAREGYISDARAQRARAEPLRVAAADRNTRPNDQSYALDAVRAVVDSVLGESALKHGDLVVYTTLDNTAQRAAERAVARHAAVVQRSSRRGANGEGVEGALVAIDPNSGAIRALVGGREYRPKSFNRALWAKRQPGSAFKPFVYAAALSAGYTPVSLVDDVPVEIEIDNRIWRPANYGNEYQGRITMREALMRSSNAATVRLARSVGERNIVSFAHNNGIRSELQAVPSIALGALEVTPVELVAAYAPFANGGQRVTPFLVRRVETADGTVLYSTEPAAQPVMDPRDAFQITSMLRSVVDNGTARSLRSAGVSVPVAGKTGTTNNGADVWFVGYTPTIVAAIWFGYDTPRSLGPNAAGGRHAAPAWADFYNAGWNKREDRNGWAVPDGMVEAVVDTETGMLAGEWCESTRREYFKPGTEPTEYADCEPEYYEDDDEWLWDVRQRIARTLKGIIRF